MSQEYGVSNFEEDVQGVLAVLKLNEGKPGRRSSIADYNRAMKELGDIPPEVLREVAARLKTAAVIMKDLYTGGQLNREAELTLSDD